MTVNSNCFKDGGQLELFDQPFDRKIRNHASARTEFGKIAELVSAQALGLRQLKISAAQACYDLQGPDGSLYESKSVRSGGACPIWCWRIAKDREVELKLGKRVFYAFVLHDSGKAESIASLWCEMAASVKSILVLPLADVEKLHKTSPFGGMKQIPGRSGYSRPGYKDGYRRVSVKELRRICSKARPVNFDLLGHRFELVIYTPN